MLSGVELPEEEDGAAEVNEAEEVVGAAIPAGGNATPALEPGEEAFDFPATFVTAQLAAVLFAGAVALLRRNQVDATFFLQTELKCLSVPGLVGNQSRRQPLHESSVESSLGEHTVVSVSRGNMDSEWKTIAVCKRHEFRRLPGTALPDAGPPFFAGT